MAFTPETSDHTSIKERIKPAFLPEKVEKVEKAVEEQEGQGFLNHFTLPVKPLAVFEGGVKNTRQCGILYSLKDYLELVAPLQRIHASMRPRH